MNILIDTNVVLDILLHRQPWYTNAVLIFGLSKRDLVKSFVTASAITDIFYICQKQQGKSAAKEAIKRLFQVFFPATVTDSQIYQALDLDWGDFEDSVQFIVGESLSVDYIVTRNTQDFSYSSIPILTPEQFIEIISDFD